MSRLRLSANASAARVLAHITTTEYRYVYSCHPYCYMKITFTQGHAPDSVPANAPIPIAPAACTYKSAAAPIATPPAHVKVHTHGSCLAQHNSTQGLNQLVHDLARMPPSCKRNWGMRKHQYSVHYTRADKRTR